MVAGPRAAVLAALLLALSLVPAQAQCNPGQFACTPAGPCIPLDWRCDASADCPGGQDEQSCGKRT